MRTPTFVMCVFIFGLLAFAARGEGERASKDAVSIIDFGNLVSFQMGGNGTFGPPGKDGVQSNDDFDKRIVDVEGMPFTKAFQVRTKRRVPELYSVELVAFSTQAVRRGDVLHMTFYLRGVEASHESGEVCTRALFERYGWPWTKSLGVECTATVGQGWKQYQYPFICQEDYESGKSLMSFCLGYPPQTIEIGGVELVNYGKQVKLEDLPITRITYPGREPGAAWRKAAAERIEKIRKADLTVSVTDGSGRSIPGASVQVQMTRHAFPFGTEVHVPTLVAMTSGGRTWSAAESEKYRQMVKKLFNTITVGHFIAWRQWERASVRHEKEAGVKAIDWAHQNGLRAIGHQLFWPKRHSVPDDLKWLTEKGEYVQKRIMDHIVDEATVLRGKMYGWVVINEPHCVYAYQVFETLGGKNMHPIDHGRAWHDDWVDTVRGVDKIAEWFKAARKCDPQAKLVLNDSGLLTGGGKDQARLEVSIKFYKRLFKHDAPVDVITEEAHFRQDLTDPGRVVEILDQLYALFGKEFWITEFDVNTPDPQLQADYLRDFLTAVFSHPSVGAFIMWGFWEGNQGQPAAAIYRKDWTAKPAGNAWNDLLFNQWWTGTTGKTDEAGRYRVRGFLGDYEITVTHAGKSYTTKAALPKEGAVVKVAVDQSTESEK